MILGSWKGKRERGGHTLFLNYSVKEDGWFFLYLAFNFIFPFYGGDDKIWGQTKTTLTCQLISHHDFRMGCDPPFLKWGSHPKMKLQGEERLLPAIGISHYDFGMGCDPPSSPLNGINDPFKRGVVTPQNEITGWRKTTLTSYLNVPLRIRNGVWPPPSPLNGIHDPFKGGGSHPKMKIEGEERLLETTIWISLYNFGMRCDPPL